MELKKLVQIYFYLFKFVVVLVIFVILPSIQTGLHFVEKCNYFKPF